MTAGSKGRSSRRCCLVGLTGGLASGKSTVARILSGRGVPVMDADNTVHDLYRPDAEGARIVARLFGREVLDASGAVDRQVLGRLVLANPSARERLEAAVHPLVRARIASWIAEQPPRRPAVVEAALLVETGSWRDYDALIVVWCRPEQQLERAVVRGFDRDRAMAVIAAQLPLEAKRRVATAVVDNSGDLEDLIGEVDRAWLHVETACGS